MQIVCELQKIQVGELKTIQVRWDTVGLGVLGKPYVSSNWKELSSKEQPKLVGDTVCLGVLCKPYVRSKPKKNDSNPTWGVRFAWVC